MFSAATGDSHTYMKVMDYEKEMGFDQLYMPHITSFTASDNADNSNLDGNLGGRPQKEGTNLTDSGIQTRTNGGNEMVKLSTK